MHESFTHANIFCIQDSTSDLSVPVTEVIGLNTFQDPEPYQ
jgi:hypothetical protein